MHERSKFLIKAIENNGKPTVINIDKSGANSGAIRVYNKRALAAKSRVKIRKCKYVNNMSNRIMAHKAVNY
jgi:putative transposase